MNIFQSGFSFFLYFYEVKFFVNNSLYSDIMNKKTSKPDAPAIEKDKVLQNVKDLIKNENAKLNTRFLESHEKVAIFLENHRIEIVGPPSRHIEYLTYNVPLSSKEYKELLGIFMEEVQKRQEHESKKKLKEFMSLINN